MSLISEESILENLVDQSARFRYSILWEGARKLLQARGIDPLKCIQLSCDQGDDVDDVCGVLIIPGGVVVGFNMKEDATTREKSEITRWEEEPCASCSGPGSDPGIPMACSIVMSEDGTWFDERVRLYFDRQLKDCDAPLPPRNDPVETGWGEGAHYHAECSSNTEVEGALSDAAASLDNNYRRIKILVILILLATLLKVAALVASRLLSSPV